MTRQPEAAEHGNMARGDKSDEKLDCMPPSGAGSVEARELVAGSRTAKWPNASGRKLTIPPQLTRRVEAEEHGSKDRGDTA